MRYLILLLTFPLMLNFLNSPSVPEKSFVSNQAEMLPIGKEDSTTIILVVVKDEKDEPMPFVGVEALRNGVRKHAGPTDIDGIIRFIDVEPGIYDIKIVAAGYSIQTEKGINVLPKTITPINIKLDRMKVVDADMVVITHEKLKIIELQNAPPQSMPAKEIKRAPPRSYSPERHKLAGVVKHSRTKDVSAPTHRKSSEVYYSDGISLDRSTSTDYEEKVSEDSYTENKKTMAGILTAGEINDFGKWNLWTDISTGQLNQHSQSWQMHPKNRYAIQLVSNEKLPLADVSVSLVNASGKVVWNAKTDNTGKAELWAGFYDIKTDSNQKNKKENYTFQIINEGKTIKEKAFSFENKGVNFITLQANCKENYLVDVMFVVDATGSMGDEISYLKAELSSIIQKVKTNNNQLNLRLGSVFYKDHADEYVTKSSNFSTDIQQTINFIQQQNAGGGGDYPEAVDAALEVAIQEMSWSKNAVARLLFLVLDAPPHQNAENLASLQKSINLAAEKGIRIIPIASSGIDKATEYLMRSFALATNGTYVFLTDHSGVGNPHIKPTTDEYDVELLNDLLLRLFNQFTVGNNCQKQHVNLKADTIFVRKAIAHVIADSTLFNKNLQANIDSQKIIIKAEPTDTTVIVEPIIKPQFAEIKYFPNPSTGPLTVEIKGESNELFLADLSGKLLAKYNLEKNRSLQLNLGHLPSGTYILKCIAEGQSLSGKVILVRN